MTTPDDGMCRWFAGCTRPAIVLRPHGILGSVPICEDCNTTLDRWVDDLDDWWHYAGRHEQP